MSRSRLPFSIHLLMLLALLNGLSCASIRYPTRLFVFPEPAGIRYYTDCDGVNFKAPARTASAETTRRAPLAIGRDQTSSVVPCSMNDLPQ